MKLNSRMNMYSNFSMMCGGNKYFGALHLSSFQSAFCYKYLAAMPLLARNEGYGRNKYGF